MPELRELGPDQWALIGSLASPISAVAAAVSAVAAVIALIFVRQQLVANRRVTDLSNNLDLFQRITVQFDKFCECVQEEVAGEAGSFPKSRRELINLLALFEHIASARKAKLLQRRSSDMVVHHVVDLVERLIAIEFSRKVIEESRHKPDILINLAWLLEENYWRFDSYDEVRRIFSIRSRKAWLHRRGVGE